MAARAVTMLPNVASRPPVKPRLREPRSTRPDPHNAAIQRSRSQSAMRQRGSSQTLLSPRGTERFIEPCVMFHPLLNAVHTNPSFGAQDVPGARRPPLDTGTPRLSLQYAAMRQLFVTLSVAAATVAT